MPRTPLSIRSRTYLLVLLPLAGLALFLGLGWLERSRTLAEMSRITRKVELSLDGGRLIHHVQLERGHSAGWLAHRDNRDRTSLDQERDRVDRYADRFRERLAGPAGDPIRERAPEAERLAILLLDSLGAIREGVDARAMSPRQGRGFYTRLNEALLHLVLRAAQEGVHPELHAYATSFTALLHLKEAAGIERAILHGVLARARFEPGSREDLLLVVARQEVLEVLVSTTADSDLLREVRAIQTAPASQEARWIRETALAMGPAFPGLDAERWFGVQTERIERMRLLEVRALRALETRAVELHRRARTHRNTFGTAGVLFMFLTLTATATSVRSVRRPLERFRDALATMVREGGESAPLLEEEGPEEMVAIAGAFNAYVVHLRDLLLRLEASEAEARGIFERVPVGLYRVGSDGRVLEVNQAFAQILGHDHPDELRGRPAEEFYVDPEDRRKAQALLERQGVVRGRELRLRHRAGHTVWVEDSCRRVTDPESGVVHVEGSVVDVTARRTAEAEVRKLSAAVTHSPDVVMITDPRGRIQYVNPAFEKVTGYSREEVLGRTPAILGSGEQDQAFYSRLWTTILAGRDFQGRFVNRRKDGTTYHLLQTISPIQGEAGRIRYFVASGKDITDQVALEQRLQHSQKLESVGQLAAGIAHDFNNLLTVILGNLEMALDDLPGRGEKLEEGLGFAREAASRGAELTEQLLAFGRRQPIQPRPLDLVETVRGFRNMSRRLLPTSIELQVDARQEEAWISMDPGQLNQILLNLTVNARDAMLEGGTLTITVDRKVVTESVPGPEGGLTPGPWILLKVSDSGVGMDPATQTRIFDPFFTTKEVGRGTGLGLATVYGIVAQNTGVIEVDSAPGRGTSFLIHFPESAPGSSAGAQDESRGVEDR